MDGRATVVERRSDEREARAPPGKILAGVPHYRLRPIERNGECNEPWMEPRMETAPPETLDCSLQCSAVRRWVRHRRAPAGCLLVFSDSKRRRISHA
jgi:hypothetical protein